MRKLLAALALSCLVFAQGTDDGINAKIRKEEAEYTDTLPYGKRGKFVSDAIKAAIEEKKEVTQ